MISDLEIECLPKNLPEYIEVDMLDVGLGETVHVKELTMPEGVEVYALAHGGGDEEIGVATVFMPRVVEETESDEVEEPGEVEATKQKADGDADSESD